MEPEPDLSSWRLGVPAPDSELFGIEKLRRIDLLNVGISRSASFETGYAPFRDLFGLIFDLLPLPALPYHNVRL